MREIECMDGERKGADYDRTVSTKKIEWREEEALQPSWFRNTTNLLFILD